MKLALLIGALAALSGLSVLGYNYYRQANVTAESALGYVASGGDHACCPSKKAATTAPAPVVATTESTDTVTGAASLQTPAADSLTGAASAAPACPVSGRKLATVAHETFHETPTTANAGTITGAAEAYGTQCRKGAGAACPAGAATACPKGEAAAGCDPATKAQCEAAGVACDTAACPKAKCDKAPLAAAAPACDSVACPKAKCEKAPVADAAPAAPAAE